MSSAVELSDAARNCAGLFRLGRDVEGALDMVELFSHLMPLFAARSETAQQSWYSILAAILKCQEGRDSLGLADYLQYELVELLQE